jgi:hypothetical protein
MPTIIATAESLSAEYFQKTGTDAIVYSLGLGTTFGYLWWYGTYQQQPSPHSKTGTHEIYRIPPSPRPSP